MSIVHPPSFEQTTPMPQIISLDCVFYIKGYFSKSSWVASYGRKVILKRGHRSYLVVVGG
jgi:hypothetical protein